MIDFVIATATPAAVYNFLNARGIVTKDANNNVVGVLPGFEYTANQIPNPFVVSGSGTDVDPYVYDTKKVYLCRFSHDTEDDQIAGTVDDGTGNWNRAKIVAWIKANGTPQVLTSANGWSCNAWKVTVGAATVFITNDISNIGVWQ